MKLSEVNVVVGILAGMKINRIADKKIKTALLNDYLHLRPHFKKANEDVEEIRRKFKEDWNDELDAVQALRDKCKPVVGHDAYLAINNGFLDNLEHAFVPGLDGNSTRIGGVDGCHIVQGNQASVTVNTYAVQYLYVGFSCTDACQ